MLSFQDVPGYISEDSLKSNAVFGVFDLSIFEKEKKRKEKYFPDSMIKYGNRLPI